jgi:hypothetical protein
MLHHIFAELMHLAERIAHYIPGVNPADRNIQAATLAPLTCVLVAWTWGRR